MPSRAASRARTLIAELLGAGEPVSFYDAYAVLQPLRRDAIEPNDTLLRALVVLHDAAQSTNGARLVLGDYLGQTARRQASQRALAEQPITFKDNGKTARAVAGTHLALHLGEKRGQGFMWQVQRSYGPVRAVRETHADATRAEGCFDVALQRPGSGRIELVETPPPAAERTAPPRTFTLQVVIEKPAS